MGHLRSAFNRAFHDGKLAIMPGSALMAALMAHIVDKEMALALLVACRRSPAAEYHLHKIRDIVCFALKILAKPG